MSGGHKGKGNNKDKDKGEGKGKNNDTGKGKDKAKVPAKRPASSTPSSSGQTPRQSPPPITRHQDLYANAPSPPPAGYPRTQAGPSRRQGTPPQAGPSHQTTWPHTTPSFGQQGPSHLPVDLGAQAQQVDSRGQQHGSQGKRQALGHSAQHSSSSAQPPPYGQANQGVGSTRSGYTGPALPPIQLRPSGTGYTGQTLPPMQTALSETRQTAQALPRMRTGSTSPEQQTHGSLQLPPMDPRGQEPQSRQEPAAPHGYQPFPPNQGGQGSQAPVYPRHAAAANAPAVPAIQFIPIAGGPQIEFERLPNVPRYGGANPPMGPPKPGWKCKRCDNTEGNKEGSKARKTCASCGYHRDR